MAVIPEKGDNPLERVFNDIDNNIHRTDSTSGGLLARWWRQIMSDLGISGPIFSERLTHYLDMTFPSDNRVAASNARGSYHKKFADTSFTWKVFLEGLKIVGIWKIEFSIKLHHLGGKTTTHTTDAILMADDTIEEYQRRWGMTHGVEKANREYIETLKKQRIEEISAKANEINRVSEKNKKRGLKGKRAILKTVDNYGNYFEEIMQQIEAEKRRANEILDKIEDDNGSDQ